ncbi:hypothetical protein [Arthrobacter sp. TE12232]
MPINKRSPKDDESAGFRTLADVAINRIPQRTGICRARQPES